ncbi:MAG TPA: TonB-dependent receptor, partial [Flavisolibacter sp.]|nr:TonB-dependent receptor [Flavisolibacter sp.]
GGGFPGAEQSRAAIFQKTFLAGASFAQQFSSAFSNQSSAYGMFTELRNPTIRNYGKATEPHVGGRTVFTYKQQFAGSALNLSFGGELQQNFTTSTVLKNNSGNPDSLQTEDDIHIQQSFVFVQGNFGFRKWDLTSGVSLNSSTLRFRRAYPAPALEQNHTLNNEVAPRVALARTFSAFTVYTSVAKGFSPPTSAELLPSGSAINLSLQAEEGVNYDLGIRGNLAKNLSADINTFFFHLKNTIVQRRDAGGGDYFTNAGKTDQKGIETSLNYTLSPTPSFLRQGTIWLSHTYHHFRYKEFKQLTSDFSGNALPGVAPHTISSGIDVSGKNGLLANLTYFYSSKIPLNDANSMYADAYHLLGAKLGYEKWVNGQWRIKLIVGADNLLNQKYSLGNDINAFGGRYYNAAAGRNYFASVVLQWFPKKPSA